MENLQIEQDVNIPAEENKSSLPVVPAGPLEITLGENIKIELNDVEATEENKVSFIRQYICSKILKMRNVSEMNKIAVNSGSLYFNNNKTSMRLPKVKTDSNGAFSESLEEYYERAKPYVKLWLTQSLQNANITVEQVEAIGQFKFAN